MLQSYLKLPAVVSHYRYSYIFPSCILSVAIFGRSLSFSIQNSSPCSESLFSHIILFPFLSSYLLILPSNLFSSYFNLSHLSFLSSFQSFLSFLSFRPILLLNPFLLCKCHAFPLQVLVSKSNSFP